MRRMMVLSALAKSGLRGLKVDVIFVGGALAAKHFVLLGKALNQRTLLAAATKRKPRPK